MRYNFSIPMPQSAAVTPFPKSKRVLFQNNPLREVVCQLRFPPVLEIASEEPAKFQNLIRKKYPLYERDEGLALSEELGDLAARLPLAARPALTHKFLVADGSRYVSVARNFVAVSETKYSKWEDFLGQVQLAKTAAEKIYLPAFYTRIGLRYVDLIDRQELGLENVAWADLVNPSLAGILAVEPPRRFVEGITSNVVLALSLPQCNAVVRMKYGLALVEDRKVFAIDSDFYTEDRRETHDVTPILNEFNRIAGDLFRWAITTKLHSALKPKPVK